VHRWLASATLHQSLLSITAMVFHNKGQSCCGSSYTPLEFCQQQIVCRAFRTPGSVSAGFYCPLRLTVCSCKRMHKSKLCHLVGGPYKELSLQWNCTKLMLLDFPVSQFLWSNSWANHLFLLVPPPVNTSLISVL